MSGGSPVPAAVQPPQIKGHVDALIEGLVHGWAHDLANPDDRLTVELLCDGEPVAQAVADLFRGDLAESGLGDGHCAFQLPLPLPLLLRQQAPALAVRVAGQSAALPGRPLQVQAAGSEALVDSLADGPALGLRPLLLSPRQGLLWLARCARADELLDDLRVELSGQPLGGLRVEALPADPADGADPLWALMLPAAEARVLPLADEATAPGAKQPLSISLRRGESGELLAEWPVAGHTVGGFLAGMAEEQAERALDTDFYLAWYTDLGPMSPAQARAHFARHGFAEGRRPSFDALLREKDLDLADLPEDFDWRCYLSLNPDLAGNGVVNALRAVHHYLLKGQAEARPYAIEADFYAEYHLGELLPAADEPASAERLQALRAEALAHWLREGVKNGLAPSFRALLEAARVPAHALLRAADVQDIRLANPQRRGRDFWLHLRRVLTQEPPLVEPLFGEDLARSVRLFLELGMHFERSGNDARAREVFLGIGHLAQNDVALEHLGNIAIRAQRWAEAASYLDRARAMGSSSPWVYLNLLNCHGSLQRFDQVLAISSEMVQRHPGNSDLEDRHLRAIHDFWSTSEPQLQALAALDQRAELCAQTEAIGATMVEALSLLVRRGDDTAVSPWPRRQRVLIVGDHFITQCVRYRVTQKVEQGTAAGLEMHTVDWTQAGSADAMAQTVLADVIIFYRTPGLPDVLRLMTTARLLGKTTFFEIDDLLFSQAYPQSLASYTGAVAPSEYIGLVRGMSLYRVAAAQCDFGIASTAPLQAQLAGLVRSGHCYLHRNALDSRSPIVKAVPRLPGDERVTVFYGSGTKAHKLEFMDELLPALLQLLDEHPQLTVRLMGHFELSAAVRQRAGDRLELVPFTSEVEIYYAQLAGADIALSILQDDEINDCKSEIKWIEAASFEVPMVVSPTRNFLDLGADGELMLMARGTAQWRSQIARLIEDPALRRALGSRSQQHVLQHYGIRHLGQQLVATLDDALERKQLDAQQQESRA